MSLKGADISSHQPDEDFVVMRDQAGVSVVAVKRTGGTSYTNPYGKAQVDGARAAGLVVIHYLYFGEPGCTDGSGAHEADYFIGVVGDDILPGEGIALDWEEAGAASIDQAIACLTKLEQHYGFLPSIYTYPSYIAEHGFASAPGLARYPLWLASYRSTMPDPPAPWGQIFAWQYSDNEDMAGVGHVDGDRFEGTLDELRAFGRPGAQAVTPGPAQIIAEAVAPSVATGPFNVHLGGGFLKTYQDAGADALALYGWPCTEELTENGKTVQYFERARFEYDQQTGAITFGRVGVELARARGLTTAQ
jgi:GH25 family lysozyme M1 (1,4-beta-N-acetylmuramidase)